MSNLYIVRGTGLSIDGSVVKIVEMVGEEYCIVSPPNLDEDLRNVMVNIKCLQKINQTKNITYKIHITKVFEDLTSLSSELVIDNCLRDAPLKIINEFLESNLKPILRME